MLSFNQLQEDGGFRFPDSSIKLPHFSRPADIPHIKLSTAFISAARNREIPLRTNAMADGETMVKVVNVVMNNIEDYLTDATMSATRER